MIRFLEFLFPLRCPVCDAVLPRGQRICALCRKDLRVIKTPYCLKCGKRLCDENERLCSDCATYPHVFDRGRALFEYVPIRRSLYRLKYGNRAEYAGFYGEEMARHLGSVIRSWEPDAIVPVPLHRKRLAKRGYNQAELLAEVIGRRLGIPVQKKLVRRLKNTVPQKNLDAAGRQNNLKKAFKLSRNDVKLNSIVIIDDIYTTGSTIDAVATVFKEAGTRSVYFVALSVGKG